MKRYIKKIGLVLFIVFIAIQFIPKKYNQNDIVSKTDFITTFNPPKNIAAKLTASCYDCHSNNTYYPWYNKIQPIAWFLEDHINEAKAELNFSEFADYSKRRQKSKLKSIMSQIRDDEMPLSSYTLMHSEAKFSEEDKKMLTEWLDNLRDNL
ncbi:MAG: heme-binding domain-containing protein [Flavobacteriaceae bacterium]|nr:heme-binding domain-containing protein [Flavobacteriaceae bacterium]